MCRARDWIIALREHVCVSDPKHVIQLTNTAPIILSLYFFQLRYSHAQESQKDKSSKLKHRHRGPRIQKLFESPKDFGKMDSGIFAASVLYILLSSYLVVVL